MTGQEYLEFNQKKALAYDSLVEKGYAGTCEFLSDCVKEIAEIFEDGFHCFVGYYDIDNISPNGKHMLFLKVDKEAKPGIDTASIMLFDIKENVTRCLCHTSAWCWQQGCRLRWINDNMFIFNDFIDGKYVTRSYSFFSKNTKIAFDCAFYDVSFNFNKAFCIDFDRLQANRPGYGYSCRKSDVTNKSALDIDGLFVMTLSDKKLSQIVSFKTLTSEVSSQPFENHYINHISISPNGKRIMYFHLWAKDSLDMWKMRVLVSDLDGLNRVVIEENDIISHYAWFDDNTLLLTRVLEDRCDYCFYDLLSGKKRVIVSSELINDGHPTFLSKRFFISDTYPLENSMQHLFLYNLEKNERIPLVEIFSDPRLYIDKRCDLHPRLHRDGLIVNFDTTYKNGVRSIKILKLEGSYE